MTLARTEYVEFYLDERYFWVEVERRRAMEFVLDLWPTFGGRWKFDRHPAHPSTIRIRRLA